MRGVWCTHLESAQLPVSVAQLEVHALSHLLQSPLRTPHLAKAEAETEPETKWGTDD